MGAWVLGGVGGGGGGEGGVGVGLLVVVVGGGWGGGGCVCVWGGGGGGGGRGHVGLQVLHHGSSSGHPAAAGATPSQSCRLTDLGARAAPLRWGRVRWPGASSSACGDDEAGGNSGQGMVAMRVRARKFGRVRGGPGSTHVTARRRGSPSVQHPAGQRRGDSEHRTLLPGGALRREVPRLANDVTDLRAGKRRGSSGHGEPRTETRR